MLPDYGADDFGGDSVDCVIDCDTGSRSSRDWKSSDAADYLHLPIKVSGMIYTYRTS